MWWVGWVLALAGGSGAHAAAGDSWLSSISRNLHAEMSGLLEMGEVNYSTPVLNTTYIASVEFDMRAMGPVYNSTHLVIDAIANEQAYPEGAVKVSDGYPELQLSWREDWRLLLAHYAGPLAVTTAALLLVPALPLAGLLWCCCYCCRGGRRRPFDRKYDACVRGLLAIVLVGLLTLFLFGVVCAFATDSQVEDGLGASPAAVRAGVRDSRAFLNETQAHARWLLVTNWRELEERLAAVLASAGVTISVKLGEFSRAVSVTTLHNMVSQLDVVAADLASVRRLTGSLRANAERLNADLRSVKAQLLQTLAACDQPQCLRLQEKHKIGQLDTEIHYSQMPDVSELLGNVTALLAADIQADVAAGARVLRDLQRAVRRSVDERIPAVRRALHTTGERLELVSSEITWAAGNASARLGAGDAAADAAQALLARYGPYRRHLGWAAATALLLVVCLMSWGLLVGVCGKRPDAYAAADCCNKAQGARCLLCGTCAMFCAGGGVAAVIVVYFLLGVAAQRLVCDPLTEPRGNRVFEDLDRVLAVERALFNERADPAFNLSYVLLRCHRNHTLYQVLQLHRLYPLSEVRERARAQLEEQVSQLAQQASPPRPVAILPPAARDKLLRLARTGLSDFDFDRILHALETNLTSVALDGLAAQLEGAAAALEARAGWAAVAASLRAAAARLRAAHAGPLLALQQESSELNATAARLREALRFNHSSLADAVAYLLHETAQAEAFLSTQGPGLVRNMTGEFGGAVAAQVDAYLARLEEAAQSHVGRCGPLSHAFNATRDAHCRKILMPVNGYWMSLSWCVLLFVPLMVVAVRLARLYRTLDPYPGPLVEAEYLYDAYADRDNVPLANAYKAEKRSAGGSGARRGGAGGAAPRGAPPAAEPHARRYNDMAPKHWEEGPPRYHGPTEYERPPPYYYPGPADRQ